MSPCYVYPTDALEDVQHERNRQDEKWGSQRKLPNGTWLAILGEEFGESAKAILERSNLREELVQVAAVAVAWIEAIDSGEGSDVNE